MKKIALLTTLTLTFSISLFAQPNMQMGEGAKKLVKMAGEKSPYYRASKEAFPKDYFMINQNLPFLVGVSLFHPNSDELKLTKEQLDNLLKMKNKTVPSAVKIAKQIKIMEFELANAMIQEHKEPKTQYELVDKISKLRTDLTKAHLQCIYDIQKVLSPEQFKTLMTLATQKPKVENPKGKELFEQKCLSCHVLGKPVDTSKLVAPPLNGVMRHLKMGYSEKGKAVAFIKDYVVNPSESKAICMPQKIKKFGLMPSQKGVVTPEELDIISNWMFENYPQKGFVGMGHGKDIIK
jgi:mono/diheme cytochrome c family protein